MNPPAIESYSPIPNQVYGYENGAASPRQNALKYQMVNEEAQTDLINGGSSRHNRSRRHKYMRNRRMTRHKRGGQAAGTELEVPSFPNTGPAVSPLTSTSASIVANQATLDAKVSACNDCHATGTCGQTIGCPQQGGRTHTRKRPFALSSKRVKISPFKTSSSVRKTLKAYKSGRKIGFTQRSSLRSMGLIPRKDGTYRLGNKYLK